MSPAADGDRLQESDLVQRARRGDASAWEPLIRLHQEAVFRYAYLLTGDPADAEDVAQETFIRMVRTFDRFDPARPLRPWLIRIARNLARNRWRSVGRAGRALERWYRAQDLDHGDRPGEATETLAGANAELRQAMRRLADTDRQVLYLRFFLEMSLDETAQVLAIPVGTVKSRTNRALGKLRRVVASDFPHLKEALEG